MFREHARTAHEFSQLCVVLDVIVVGGVVVVVVAVVVVA